MSSKRFKFNRGQIANYIEAFTGEKVSVLNASNGGSTHIPSKVVRIAVDHPGAADIAAHEALHITSTDPEASRGLAYHEHFILNALEDGRMERKAFHAKPGLKTQFQRNIVNAAIEQMKDEAWLIQSIKAMSMTVAGYDFDKRVLKPKARKVIARFEAEIAPKAREAKTTNDLVPLIPQVIDLFNEYDGVPFGQTPEPTPPPSIQIGDDEYEPIDVPMQPKADEDDEADEGAPRMPVVNPEGDATESERETYSREAVSYDATDRSMDEDAEDAIAKYEGREDESHDDLSAAGEADSVNGIDKVSGGPTANRLIQQASRLASKIHRLEDRISKSVDDSDMVEASEAITVRESKRVESVKVDTPLADPDAKMSGDYFNPVSILNGSVTATGSVGYSGYGMRLSNLTDRKLDSVKLANIKNVQDLVRPLCNSLALQMRVFSQTNAGVRTRDHQRYGRLDTRRSYQLAGGRSDVYRQSESGGIGGSAVVLSVDMSGSMGYRMQYDLNAEVQSEQSSPNTHALAAALMMGEALDRVGIPYEIHGFAGSVIYIIKKFNDRMRLESMYSIYDDVGGGTQAAESLAFGWIRLSGVKATKRIVIQITDGSVGLNTREVANLITGKGGVVIGVGVNGGDDSYNMNIYPNFVGVANSRDLTQKFAALIRRLAAKGVLGER